MNREATPSGGTVYTVDSKSTVARHASSNLASGTERKQNVKQTMDNHSQQQVQGRTSTVMLRLSHLRPSHVF